MFDTNVFNRILDGRFDSSLLPPGSEIWVTHVQRDEILKTSEKYRERRESLIKLFEDIVQEQVSTESFILGKTPLGQGKLGGKKVPTKTGVFDLSNWDEAEWAAEGESYYDRLLARLRELDSRPEKEESHKGDALIAETAIANQVTLISSDRDLVQATREAGGQVIGIP